MDEPIAMVSSHLIFRKGSPLVEPINNAIVKNRVAIVKIFRKYMEYVKRIDNPNCSKLRAPVETPYVGTCVIYLILIGVSTLVFIVERLFWHFYHKPRKSVTI
jgi:hypothetical protein